MKPKLLRWVALAAFACVRALPAFALDEALRAELLEMQVVDQKARKAHDVEAMRAADAKHTARLKEIIEKVGWPPISMVGVDGASAAWLIAQHADRDPDFQKRALQLMDAAVKSGEASGTQFAYLHDRTHTPQRYGTQGKCVAPGRWEPLEIEDPDGVDERRKAVSMYPPTLAEYAKLVSQQCKWRSGYGAVLPSIAASRCVFRWLSHR